MNSDMLKYGTLVLLGIAAITCFLPVELYDGYALLDDGTKVDEKLSLSYLINKSSFIKGYADQGVVDIALKPVGWILVGIVNVGLPYLIGYRISMAKDKKRATNDNN
jgi:hypothetical protein